MENRVDSLPRNIWSPTQLSLWERFPFVRKLSRLLRLLGRRVDFCWRNHSYVIHSGDTYLITPGWHFEKLFISQYHKRNDFKTVISGETGAGTLQTEVVAMLSYLHFHRIGIYNSIFLRFIDLGLYDVLSNIYNEILRYKI